MILVAHTLFYTGRLIQLDSDFGVQQAASCRVPFMRQHYPLIIIGVPGSMGNLSFSAQGWPRLMDAVT